MSKPESVTVAGTGVVAAPPDVLRLDLGIEAHAVTVQAALEQANDAMAAVQGSLLGSQVPRDDLRTTGLGIGSEYDREGRSLAGYVVHHGLDVRLRDISAAGGVIAAAVAAGGDQVRINGLRFDVENDVALLEQARRAAVDDARRCAQTLADAAGRSVGRALRISEGSAQGPAPVRARMMATEAAGAVPVQAGSHEVSATVTVEWSLE